MQFDSDFLHAPSHDPALAETEKAAEDNAMSVKFRIFAALHVKGDPVILYNAWDAGSARAVAHAGARAIATGSWSVAAAQGFDDGEELPLELALSTAARIAGAISLPVTIDFEGGYAVAPEDLAANMPGWWRPVRSAAISRTRSSAATDCTPSRFRRNASVRPARPPVAIFS